MVLIVGAEGSGKRSYAYGLGYSSAQVADGVLDDKPVVCHVERIVAETPRNTDALFIQLCGKEVVICNEVGSGVIPVDNQVRLAREATGRLCVLLAQRADTVVRMVCGIPTVIKGERP